MSKTLYQRYRADIASWDWKGIIQDCKDNYEEIKQSKGELCTPVDQPLMDEKELGCCYLGSVLDFAPSGKFYTPWARSNVDLCPMCKGKGETKNKKTCNRCGGLGSWEAYCDQEYFQALEDIAEKHGLFISDGAGDFCDLFACMTIEEKDDGESTSSLHSQASPFPP